MPYVVQKLPISVDMKHNRAIVLNIVDDKQYQELIEVAAEPAGHSFSLQLLAYCTARRCAHC